MFSSLYDLGLQFYNWLTTGSSTTAPQNGGLGLQPPPAPPAPLHLNAGQPPHVGGNLADQIANDPRAVAIRQAAAARANGGGIPFPPPPPMNGLNAMAMNVARPVVSLQEELQSAKVLALRVRAHVRAREGERGHVLARHHPSLTDEQLQNRLLTGLDPEGNPAPTSGVSSRFASEGVFFESLKNVHQKMAAALNNSAKYLRANLKRCADAEATFHATPAGPAKGDAQKARTDAYSDLRVAMQVLQTLPDHLPVQWDDVRRCIILYPKYAINLYHAKQLGEGFYGTGPKPNTAVGGKIMTIYQRVQRFNGPAENTLTVFTTPDSPMNTLGRKHSIESWGLVTHYPQFHEEKNVRIEGSN